MVAFLCLKPEALRLGKPKNKMVKNRIKTHKLAVLTQSTFDCFVIINFESKTFEKWNNFQNYHDFK